MRKSIVLILAILLTICSCSDQEIDYNKMPENAQAGKVYNLTTSKHEDSGREIVHATLVVAENRETPGSRLLALPIKIYKSSNPDPEEPVFWLTGGPGKSNLHYWPSDELLAQRDMVLLGYRGMDGSTRLDCPEFLDGTFNANMFSKEAISVMRNNICDRQIQHYSRLWANDPVYSKKTDDLAGCIKRVMNNMPKRWLFFNIDPDKVRFATFMGLFNTSGAGSVFDTFIAADNGDASGLALVSFMTKLQLKK